VAFGEVIFASPSHFENLNSVVSPVGDPLSFQQRKESRQRNAAALNPSFYLNSKIKIPSSLIIFVVAAELTN